MTRISHLDGLRGVAILLVIGFHAYTRWPSIVPYGNTYASTPIFEYGYLGVHLFFLISGFVIFMSLEKSANIFSFIYRRWLRLFPAMLICSVIIYLTSAFFVERPHGQPSLKDFIPGLTFVEPYVWLKLTGLRLDNLEGAFWSLYVEFKFYIVASILYFLFGSKRLVALIFLCFVCWLSLGYLSSTYAIAILEKLHTLCWILGFEYFGWFAAGAAYYSYSKTRNQTWIYVGIFISILSAFSEGEFALEATIAALIISSLFALSIISSKMQQLMNNKILLYFGFVSYPLYLLHENMMIASVIKMEPYLSFVPSVIYPVIAVALISILAFAIAKHVEPWVKAQLMKFNNMIWFRKRA